MKGLGVCASDCSELLPHWLPAACAQQGLSDRGRLQSIKGGGARHQNCHSEGLWWCSQPPLWHLLLSQSQGDPPSPDPGTCHHPPTCSARSCPGTKKSTGNIQRGTGISLLMIFVFPGPLDLRVVRARAGRFQVWV